MTRNTYLIFAFALLLPLGIRFSLPIVIRQGETLSRTWQPSPQQPLYQVTSVQGTTLTLQSPGSKQSQSVQLAGLAPLDPKWRTTVSGVLIMLVEDSQVSLTWTDTSRSRAIVQLVNGMSLQQVLLSDGLAKLDESQLKQFPIELAKTFQQAQASAQQQRKNIWG